MLFAWFALVTALLVVQPASAPPSAASFDFAMFRDKVQPIFLAKRPGHARCVTCHAGSAGSLLRLQPLSPGSTTWNDEQTRRNFEAVQRLVTPGDPLASRLLMHPLAKEAGGDPFHAGGKHWTSQSDPEWESLAAWVRTGVAVAPSAGSTTSLNFDVYRTRVEPIFLKPREAFGGTSCVSCHATVASRLRLQALPAGATAWTEEQSRRNFETVSRLVVPGEPLKSRLLLHPLAAEAGGDPSHTGGKFWPSQNDPEWQALSEWVRSGSAAPGGTAPSRTALLDYDFFKTRIEPIFLLKRPGHARCIVCHEGSNTLPLARRSPGADSWDEEQSRRMFEAMQRLVVPGDPAASRLLMHPLSRQAGGDPFHAGGKHWESQNDPEWQTLAAWVRGDAAAHSLR